MKVRKILLICLMVCTSACVGIAALLFGGCNVNEVTYTVSYERGADDATGAIPAMASYAEGAKVTLAAASTFSRNGYTFDKWSAGSETYDAGSEFTMPAKNVTFTATWTKNPPNEEKDEPTLTELANKFYTADNWVYMTNNAGASLDGGDVPYTLNDGSIKFHRLNQAIEMGDLSNSTASFMLKGTNDWSIWFNSSSKDNSDNYSYRLAYANGGLRLALSSAPDLAAAVVSDSSYEKAEWNRFDIVFETSGKTCQIKLYVNGERANLVAGDNVSGVTVADNVLTHVQPAMFVTGNYIVVKVWEAHNYVQIKPVAKAQEKDVPIIACIGASITEGAGAGNFYTESYPAQLQKALGGDYNVVNFGNSGKTVKLNPEDGEAWLEQNQWKGVQAIVPDMAILNIGTNDSKSANLPSHDSFKAAYEYLIEQILSVNTQMEICICTVPYAYSSVYGISNENIRDIIAPVQREIAEENDYTLIDLYEIVQNKSLLFGDGVHPNSTGYAMFVEIITKVLSEGEEGLTGEFLNYIDEKYNDPEYELSDIHAEVTETDNKINLTVTGNLDIADASKLRLVVETGTQGEEREVAMTTDANGDFSGTINIADLTSTSWYNVRVYITETFYYFVRLNETDYSSGDTFFTDSKVVTVKTWESGGENTFSFSVAANDGSGDITLSAISIEKSGNAINLTIEGKARGIKSTVYDKALLYIGSGTLTAANYESLCIPMTETTAGEFSITYDLAQLDVGDGYQIRIYRLLKDDTIKGYYTVKFSEVSINDGDILSTDEKELTFATTTSWKPVEIKVREVGSVELTSTLTSQTVTMEDGKIYLNVAGTTNDEELKLVVDDGKGHSKEQAATFNDGSFTVSLDISELEAIGDWYFGKIVYSDSTSDDLMRADVLFGGFALVPWVNNVSVNDNKLYANDKVIKPQNTDKFAFTVSAETGAKATVTSITMENGKYIATVATMNTTLTGAGLYDFPSGGEPSGYAGTVTGENGYYTVEVDLSAFSASGSWYYLALKLGEGALAKADFPAHGSNTVKYAYNDLVFTTKYSWATAIQVGTLTNVMISSVSFEDDQLVVYGAAASSVSKLQLYLNNTNITGTGITSGKLYENTDVTIETDRTFVLRIDLSNFDAYNIKTNALNLRMLVNDSTAVVTANTDINLSATYVYNGKTYAFKTQNSTIALTTE